MSREELNFYKEKLNGKRVLIIDDQPSNVSILVDMVVMFQGLPSAAYSGAEGLTLLNDKKVVHDVALIDIQMPEIDGWTIIRHIHEHKADYPHLITVAVTAFLPSRRKEALAAGFDEYCAKPIGIADLVVMVGKLLSRQESERPSFEGDGL